ncbi:MAG: galactokinase [Oscillospiraceae bacterium]
MPTTAELKQQMEGGLFDAAFANLYGPGEERALAQRSRYAKALQAFEEIYGGGRQAAIYSAPGRTEIGGNHTDHNHGIVMAAAVNLDIIAVVAQNSDNCIRVHSQGFGTPDVVELASLEPNKQEFGRSSALIRGVAAAIKQRGGVVGGFDAYTTNDVLRGSGLSSSAAFEVCMAAVLNGEYNKGRFTPVELGIIGQYAENKFFGKPSGLMDQTASAVGSAITIDFKNPENPVVEKIPFDLAGAGYQLVITDTKGSHAGLTDEYAAIRQEMESVAKLFGGKVLRDVDRETFMAQIPMVRKAVGDRAVLRSIHFYEECRRAPLLAGAAGSGNFALFLKLILEGGKSSFEYNQNAYSVHKPAEQGVSLGLALSQLVLEGSGAWRLQGGGFAGTIQAFVPNHLLGEYCSTLTKVFGGDACYVLSVRGPGAVKVLP